MTRSAEPKSVTITAHSDPQAFAALVRPWLLQDEAVHCLPLGIVDALAWHPERFPGAALLAIEGAAGVEGMAWQTPPYPLGLSLMSSDAVDALIEYTASSFASGVAGVVGPKPPVELFKERWLARRGARLKKAIEQRIYRLDRVTPEARAPGAMRPITAADESLVLEWTLGFAADCGLDDDEAALRRGVTAALADGSRVLWELEGAPVSMAGFSGRTPSGIRVNYVYTPPRWRGRGYASALVAALSEHLLATGRKCCFLFTDLANPTSNRIYSRIGYRPVGDAAYYTFAE